MVVATLKLFQEGGMVAATSLKRNPNSDISRLKVTGDIEAKIVAKACSSAPNGYARWTLTLLTNEMKVILEEELSRATIGRTPKNNDIRPHLTEYWCIPPEADAEFRITAKKVGITKSYFCNAPPFSDQSTNSVFCC